MNIPEKALELARQGGWDVTDGHGYFEAIALDKDFWIGLSKALGWEKKMVVRVGAVIGNFVGGDKFVGEEMGFGMDYFNPEIYYAHRFYDLILTGGDTEKFWEEILN